MAYILDFLVDSLVELIPLRQVGAGAAFDPLPELLQEHLQAPGIFSLSGTCHPDRGQSPCMNTSCIWSYGALDSTAGDAAISQHFLWCIRDCDP